MDVEEHSQPFGKFALDCRHFTYFFFRIGNVDFIIHIVHPLQLDSRNCISAAFPFDRDRFLNDRES